MLFCWRAFCLDTGGSRRLEGLAVAHTSNVGARKKESMRDGGPKAVGKQHVQASTTASGFSVHDAGSHAGGNVLGRHADGSGHEKSSKNAEKTNEHCIRVGGGDSRRESTGAY